MWMIEAKLSRKVRDSSSTIIAFSDEMLFSDEMFFFKCPKNSCHCSLLFDRLMDDNGLIMSKQWQMAPQKTFAKKWKLQI